MGRRRGFFAELQYQAAKAQKERARQAAATERERARLAREMHRAQQAAIAANKRAAHADVQARAQAEREAKQLHLQAQLAQVESMNADLADEYAAIDDILRSTLAVDDYADLERLRRVAKHPPFTSKYLTPLPPPALITAPREPFFQPPPAPSGLSAMFSKKKHAAEVAAAEAQFAQVHANWRGALAQIPARQLAVTQQHQDAEGERLRRLAADRRRYDAECEDRQRAADTENARLDDLINRFAHNDPAAVDEYIGIVFGNSIYPEIIAENTEFDFAYSAELAELRIDIHFPPRTRFPLSSPSGTCARATRSRKPSSPRRTPRPATPT